MYTKISKIAFKGAQPATRYEMASVVARALVTVDAEKASKQDLELLKKLVMEFKDELDALGVKVDSLDKRVAVLEEGLGGWQLHGTFRFDARFADSDTDTYAYNRYGERNQFDKEQFRLFLTKQLSENTYFYAQYRTGGDSAGGPDGMGDLQHMRWSHLFINTVLPWDMNLRIGRFSVDFESDYGLYIDNDAMFGDFRVDGFQLSKQWNTFKATAIVGRNNNWGTGATLEDMSSVYDKNWQKSSVDGTAMTYVLDLNWQPSEAFMLGATGYWIEDDSDFNAEVQDGKGNIIDYQGRGDDASIANYGIYAKYDFTPAIGLKGVYYFQDLGDDVVTYGGREIAANNGDDSPTAWKAILDIDQDLLKFTSLWVEYSQQDNSFLALEDRYSIGGGCDDYVGKNMAYADLNGTSEWWFVKATQKWNDKWSSFVRFVNVDFDTNGLDDSTEWGVGIGYQYTPALYFELAYAQVDHGDNSAAIQNAMNDTESVIRFRTTVNF
ncbi:MAG TPA: S-layer homology domain-containing protein [Candidatus Caccocola faecigallinarum]|nr:S-layer homology domain-containing protein [Candidatus Caccocola faecigallinarum]